jgi:16S rRNA (uracil1498-N3)-methyltransferase
VTHRFFVESEIGDEVTLVGEQAHQIANVLRLEPGAHITVIRDGTESDVRLESVSAAEVRGRSIAKRVVDAEPRVRLTLALPILKGDRTEKVIEAVTQLGVSHIAPFVSARSVVRALAPAKRERWGRIAREASETARRGRIPSIDEPRQWEDLIGALDGPVVVAWEGEALTPLRAVVPETPRFSVVIGPEGGLSMEEIHLAREHGAITVSLGRRNLRSETAAIAAVSLIVSMRD